MIWRLHQEGVEEERREENAWFHAQNARRRRGKRNPNSRLARGIVK